MNARNYRVSHYYSPLDFPAISGLGESSTSYHSEPFLNNDKLLLTITTGYILDDYNTNKKHVVLTVKAIYEIPTNEIKSRNDVYEFYKDALQGLNEVYKAYKMEMPALTDRIFPIPPIEHYKPEIDRVFNLLERRN